MGGGFPRMGRGRGVMELVELGELLELLELGGWVVGGELGDSGD